MKKLLSMGLLIISITSVLMSACTGKSSDAQSQKVFIFGRPADAVGLDPARETDGESFAVSSEIYEGLVGFAPGTTEVIPVLAENYTISADGLEYIFKIRKNVKFHDNTVLNADAIVFNFDRQSDENNEYFQYGPFKYWGYMDFANIVESVEAVDEYTVRIILKKPDASFIASMAMDFITIVSPTAVQKFKGDFTNNPVGTGPFKFVSWQKGDSVVLEANKDYWQGAPNVDRVVFKVIPDPTARALSLQNGEIDAFVYPSPDDIQGLRDNADISLIENNGLNVGYMAFNTQKKPFDDVRVRRALNHAIDKQAIIKAAYGELGTAAYAPIPPTMWAFNPDITRYEFDIAKAKALLAEAGYPDGISAELLVLPVTRPYNPQGQKVAEIMQQQFAKIGVTIKLQTLEWGTHLERTDRGDYELGYLGWIGDNGDPDNFLGVLLAATRAEVPASNIAFWKNAEFTKLIEQAVIITDIEQRKKLYLEAQEIFAKEVPWIVLANSKRVVPYNKRIKNLVIQVVGEGANLRNVSIQ